jgi:hypothetical protein
MVAAFAVQYHEAAKLVERAELRFEVCQVRRKRIGQRRHVARETRVAQGSQDVDMVGQ